MDFDEESQQEVEILSKLHAALGPEKHVLDGFTLVSSKRRKKDLRGASASDAMEAGAAAAALVEAVAKAAKEAADKAAADQRQKQR